MFRKNMAALLYGLILTAFTAYFLLDTFVIARVYSTVPEVSAQTSDLSLTETEEDTAEAAEAPTEQETETSSRKHRGSGERGRKKTSSDAADSASEGSGSGSGEDSVSPSSASSSSETTYQDENMTVTLTEYQVDGTTVYAADIQLSSASYLKTALAKSAYGKNVTETTSEMAESNNAVLAINGDYYGAQEKGYVLRNGVLYRNTAEKGQEDLVIYEDGSFEIIVEDEITAEELLEKGAVQILSFGPALITDGKVSVTENDEVGRAMASNPRTAIGIIDDLHYVFVVSDGRTDESQGLTLYQLSQFMESLGADTAYNLDGGGSSSMVFQGVLVNNPTTTGNSIKERSVSDIVYIG
ncbi:MAG: phosphodiester glycosidase family protein [Lachnospiraceae bacterium]|nr:phosphodiester glycosidase family protein [Lachnospiraceae bacterium]